MDRGEKPPERTATRFTRMVQRGQRTGLIESADYELNISAPEWRLTSPRRNSAPGRRGGLGNVLRQLNEALEKQKRGQKDRSGMGRVRYESS